MRNQGISKMKEIRGFSLIEILMVAGLVAVVGAFLMMISDPHWRLGTWKWRFAPFPLK